MALKRLITKAEYEKLSKELKAEYNLDGENAVLDLTDYEDPTKLKQAKDHEVSERKKIAAELKAAKEELATITAERDGMLAGHIPKGDVEKLEASHKKKLADREKELNEQIAAQESTLQTMLVDNVAVTMATKLSKTSAKVLLPHIKSRLKAEKVDGKFVTKVVDATGAPSALTVEDLEKEIVANKEFAPILTASQASGGAGGGQGRGGAGSKSSDKPFNYNTASAKDIAAHLRETGKIPAAAAGA